MKKSMKKLISFVIAAVLLVTTAVSQPLTSFASDFGNNDDQVASIAGAFVARTTEPGKSVYYYSGNPFQSSGYGMWNTSGARQGNCTAYAWGRAYEILGSRPKLGTGNAGSWWNYNKNNNFYRYGSTPQLGAVAVWDKYDGNQGHVAVVESISGDSVTISESHWKSVFFDTRTIKANSSNYLTSMRFLGYIYVNGDSSPAILPGTVDSTWNVPANVTAGYKIQTYDAWGNAESGHYIDPGDNCYVEAVYTNGFARVKYPTSSGDRWAYAKASDFALTKNNVSHVHNYAEYQFFEADHPHYKCYKCSICGEIVRNVNEPTYLDSCNSDVCKYAGYGEAFYANIVIGDDLPITNSASGVNGASAKLGSNLTDRSAIWKFVRTPDNYYAIYSCVDDLVLEMQNGDTNPTVAQDLVVSSYQGKTSQKWAITLMADKWWEDNYCNIVPMCNTNLSMDVYNADINSGTNVWVCRRNGTVAQRFRIVILDRNFTLSKPTPIVYPGGSKSDTVIRWAGIDHADSYNVKIVSQTGTVIVNETVYGNSVYAKNLPAGKYTATVTAVNNRYIDMAAQSVPVEFEVVSETGEKKDSVICGNKKYELYDYALNWNDANAFCESKNGKLAEVLSAEEQRAVEQLVKSGSYDYYWLGLTDQEKEGEFKWNSGNAVGYTNWDSGEPNNSAEGENYVMVYKSSGKWNDVLVYGGLNGRTGFVCESEAPKTYNISYYLNGGSNDSSNPVSYTSDNPYLNLKNPVRSNYTFDGWYTTRTYSTRLTSSTKCEGDLDLYAKWIPTQYTVQLDVNGGKTLSQSKYNATVETTGLALPTPERDGYTFTGWYNKITGGDKVSSISNVTQNITLYARWEKNPEPHVHEFATLVEEVKATCTEGGHATYRCECGSEKLVYTAATGHNYGDWKVIKEATYLEPGLMRRVCKNDSTHVESKKIPVLVKDQIDISGCDVELSYSSCTYNKSVRKPAADVSRNGILLTEGKDYTVSYRNNKAPGVAKVIISGKGDYKGTLVKTFTIKVCDISAVSNNARIFGITNVNYTGKAQTQSSLAVTVAGKALTKGVDYNVSYKNNKNIGKAVVTITGIGAYKGSIKTAFKITVKNGGFYRSGNYKYKVTNAATNGTGTVTLVGTYNKRTATNYKSLTINDSVKIGGVSFKITAIGNKAFYGYKYLTYVAFGKNIRQIGAQTFYGCANLKKIKFTCVDLKTVGIGAFTKIYAKPVVKVPAAKYTKYKTVLKRGGMPTKTIYK